MRAYLVLAVVVPIFGLAASCSSSSSSSAAAAAGASGSGGDSGSGGAGGATGGHATAAGTGGMGGDQGQAGDGAGGQVASGGHFGSCPELGDPNLTRFKHFGCGMCAQAQCDSELTSTFGPNWSSGDYTSGGSCADFMSCIAGCHCDTDCVSKQCFPSQDCDVVRMATDACLDMKCLLPCGSGGGGGGPSSSFGGGGGLFPSPR